MTEIFPDFTESDACITSDRIRRLLAYWQNSRSDRPVPLQADIDPNSIRDLLPYLVIVEFEQPFRVRYRLVGTRVVEFNRLDFTGAYLDDMRWDTTSRYSRAYRAVADTGRPHFGLDSWLLAGSQTGRSEIAMLPTSTDGKRVDRCVAIEDFLFSHYDLVERQD